MFDQDKETGKNLDPRFKSIMSDEWGDGGSSEWFKAGPHDVVVERPKFAFKYDPITGQKLKKD